MSAGWVPQQNTGIPSVLSPSISDSTGVAQPHVGTRTPWRFAGAKGILGSNRGEPANRELRRARPRLCHRPCSRCPMGHTSCSELLTRDSNAATSNEAVTRWSAPWAARSLMGKGEPARFRLRARYRPQSELPLRQNARNSSFQKLQRCEAVRASRRALEWRDWAGLNGCGPAEAMRVR